MKKKHFKLKELMDIPPEFSGEYYMEIYSGEKVVLTGFGEIVTYEDSVLKIRFGEKTVVFSGEKLGIKNYSGQGMEVLGKIEKIELPKRGDIK